MPTSRLRLLVAASAVCSTLTTTCRAEAKALPFKLKRIGKISIKESLVKGKMAIAKRTVNG